MDSYKGILISSNWDCVKSFQWLCENAKFIFSHKSYSGERPKIVLKEPINEIDCIEIGYDRYGVMAVADTNFGPGWGNAIEDSSKDIVGFLKDWLIKDGATDLITNLKTNL